MPHTPGPFTVEELGDSAETGRDLGVTRIVCAPAQYEDGEKIAIAFVVFPDDAPLFAASAEMLAALEDAERILALMVEGSPYPSPTLERVRLAIARARAVV